jgi:hypothetical protein
MSFENIIHSDLPAIKSLLYEMCDYSLNNFKLDRESTRYSACSFELNGQSFIHRVSKITPTKVGQFVTIWKRNKNGITTPFDISDNIDWFLITSKSGDNIGQFIFHKAVLADKGIISTNGKGGKRGIRVYPPWNYPLNKQAKAIQQWQQKFFSSIIQTELTESTFLKKLFDKSNIN